MGKVTEIQVDTRYCYGAMCTWHGPVQEVGQKGRSVKLPVCPHCGHVLFENDSKEVWDGNVAKLAARLNQPAYVDWVQSLHDSGTCHPLNGWNWEAAFYLWLANRA